MLIKEAKKEAREEIFKGVEGSIILLQGIFKNSAFDRLGKKKREEIVVLEGRPSLEAAKSSCHQLLKRKIRPTLIADNMAGFLFYKRLVKEVWLSYQVADGKGALCQIGGLILGVLGKKHKIAVNLFPSGRKIDLIGHQNEIFHFNGVKVAPGNIRGYVPLAEWLPRKYITKIYE